ncbi:hypothetical protein D3C72_1577500 [compost metagenome]
MFFSDNHNNHAHCERSLRYSQKSSATHDVCKTGSSKALALWQSRYCILVCANPHNNPSPCSTTSRPFSTCTRRARFLPQPSCTTWRCHRCRGRWMLWSNRWAWRCFSAVHAACCSPMRARSFCRARSSSCRKWWTPRPRCWMPRPSRAACCPSPRRRFSGVCTSRQPWRRSCGSTR